MAATAGRHARTEKLDVRPGYIVPVIGLAVAMLVGGSVQIPLGVMTAELAALLAAASWAATSRLEDWRHAIPALVFAALVAALGIVQLVPLDAASWAALPGHDTVAAIAQTTGTMVRRPISLDPDATGSCLMFTAIGFCMALVAISARPSEIRVLYVTIIATAVVSALLGMLQIAGGSELRLYPESHTGGSIGLFANRNHHADFLMIGLILLAGEVRRMRTSPLRPFLLAIMALLAISTIMTGSRLGIAILPFSLIGSVLLVYARPGSPIWVPLAAVLLVVAVAALLAAFVPSVSQLLGRYGTLKADPRYAIWIDTRVAIGHFWPYGSGIGTFVPVYSGTESLEAMTDLYVVHAHNDYLEIALETGIAGLALVAAYGATILTVAIRAATAASRRPEFTPALLGLVVLLIHSIGDFPLRTPALIAVFGVLNGALIASARSAPARAPRRQPVSQ